MSKRYSDEIFYGPGKVGPYADGGLINPVTALASIISGGCVQTFPHTSWPYVGDVPTPAWPGPGWYWDALTQSWRQTLTYQSSHTTLDSMARSEVIEYTFHRFPTGSSAVEEIWYHEDTGRMTLRFPRGGLYSYDDVPNELFREFMDAESLGRFFAIHFNASDNKWEGAKHVESRTKFVQVEREPIEREVDLDAFKVDLTTGHGTHEFTVHFEFSAGAQMKVRAKTMDEAVKAVEEYAAKKGYTADVTGVYQPIKKKG